MYGLPYKGSKSRLATKIVEMLPSAGHFYDIFAGGGAITHRAVLAGRWDDYALNDINPLMPRLFMDCIDGRYHDERRWVSRGEFHEKKGTDALVAVCWSFGNNLADYVFGEDVEPVKRALYDAVVNGDYTPMRKYGIDLSGIDGLKGLRQRRLAAQEICQKHGKYFILEPFRRYERLRGLERIRPFKEKIHAVSTDYRNVEILSDSVVYCDIPYKGTDGYGVAFDHEQFYDWACSQREPVYVSSYEIPADRFECVAEFALRTTYCKDSNSKQVIERLFIPKGQKKIKTTLF